MGRELAAAEAALGQVEVNCCICRGTHLAGAMFFFIDLQSEISGGATAWLGAWGLDQLYRGTVRRNSEGDCGREH